MTIKCTNCQKEKEDYFFYKINPNRKERYPECIACRKRVEKLSKQKKRRKIMDDKRRKPNIVRHCNLVLYKKPRMTKAKALIYKSKATHLFFQYNAIIYDYVRKEHGLSFNDLNLLFMLHPIKPFTRKDLIACREIMEFNNRSSLNVFMEKDLIKRWEEKHKQATLYEFTTKGEKLIMDIYLWAVGKKELPVVEESNSMKIMANLRRLRIKRK